MIRNDIPHSKVDIKTNIHCFMQCRFDGNCLNRCSFSSMLSLGGICIEVKKLVDQLLKLFILWDFSRHNTL